MKLSFHFVGLMLAVSPLRSTKDEKQEEMERFSDDFGDLSDGNLLESINFDDLFSGINDGDVLPDLEMDPEIFAEFSVSTGEESEMNSSAETRVEENIPKKLKVDEDKVSSINSGMASGSISGSSQGEEIVSKRDESIVVNPSPKEPEKGRKSSSSAQSKNNSQGKRKVKVIK